MAIDAADVEAIAYSENKALRVERIPKRLGVTDSLLSNDILSHALRRRPDLPTSKSLV